MLIFNQIDNCHFRFPFNFKLYVHSYSLKIKLADHRIYFYYSASDVDILKEEDQELQILNVKFAQCSPSKERG